jgi:apolipoprotein D and lipocalin family protein
MTNVRTLLLLAGGSILLVGCTGIPEGVQPVTGFELDRYLGTWYEIARLDHSFERGLSRVTAHYRKSPEGSVEVLNRGYDAASKLWKEAHGRAVVADDPATGSLEVTFFWPFAGGYHVFALDREAYQWAMIAGPSRGYLWILSRRPILDPGVRENLIDTARRAGFDTEALIWVEQP